MSETYTNPWNIDADNFDFSKVDVNRIYDFIVPTSSVKEYLQFGHNDKKMIVVAPKGLGKTLLLKAKSYIYRESHTGYQVIPSGAELVEKLVNIQHSFPKESIETFKQREIWEQLWELSISIWIFIELKAELPIEIERELHHANNLYDIVRYFLTNRQSLIKFYRTYLPTNLSPRINTFGNLALFIDNVDEGLEQHIGEDLKLHKSENVSEQVWLNAQIGLMHVIRNMCSRNKHLKIFASVRSEAANCDMATTSRQLRLDWCIDLKYSKKQIKEIFEQKIRRTPKENLRNPDHKDPIVSFIGFSKISHRFAKENNQTPRQEDVFDFIYRHTLGRPRDVVSIGKALNSKDKDERDEDLFREIVNDESDLLLNSYKKEIVPYFENEVFETFCELANKNVISETKKQEITKIINDQYDFPDVFTYLYSLGLIGTVEHSFAQNSNIQRFLPVGEYAFAKRKKPKSSKYYILHSAIDKTLKDLHDSDFYDQNNIIGDGYKFYAPQTEKTLHVHFGLSKDSLSLIIPEFCKSKTIAIFQFPSSEYYRFGNAEKFILKTNCYEPINFRIINKKQHDKKNQEVLDRWEKGENIVIYHNDIELLAFILNKCETISIEGKNTIPTKALQKLDPVTTKFIYLCQRFIHKDSLNNLKTLLREYDLYKMTCIRTSLIDRLTYKDSIRFINDEITQIIESEQYGKIICLERQGSKNEHNAIVRRTLTLREQFFYETRQKFLVEGTYRITKIIRTQLTNSEKNNRTFVNKIYNIFFDIQILRLLQNFNKEEIQQFLGLNSETQIFERLRTLCNKTRKRFEELNKRKRIQPQYLSGIDEYIYESKILEIFPKDEEFYYYIKRSQYYIENLAITKLQDIMLVNPLSKYRKVFISFTDKDKVFASVIHDCLKKRGVDAYLYTAHPRTGTKIEIEKDEIKRREKILFIASENSLKSSECHQEISIGIEKMKGLIATNRTNSALKNILIPITVDDFILKRKSDLLQLLNPTSHSVNENIEIIMDNAIHNFIRFKDIKIPNNDLEKQIDQTIIPAITKRFSNTNKITRY